MSAIGHSVSALRAKIHAKPLDSCYFTGSTSAKTPLSAVTENGANTERVGPVRGVTAEHALAFGEGQGFPVNVLPAEKRLRVFAALVDGNSTRAVERMTDVHQRTIRRFGLMLGAGAESFHNARVRDLRSSLIAVDEIWSYVQKKQARVTPDDAPGVGEAYTFVGIDTLSRLAISWCVGKRNQETTNAFMADLRSRLAVMPQITSDGFSPYISAVGAEFGPSVDFAQTVKNYSSRGRRDDDHRYEPPRGIDFISKRSIFGAPDMDTASTALVERLNGTTRHFVGRMRRLSYAFSKTLEGHKAAMALHYTHYNWCHVVRTLRVTPAMQAGLTDHVWDLGEMMEALLSAPPCARPDKAPLEHRVPEVTSRALPNGRGFLRLVGPGKGPSPEGPTTPLAPMPVAPLAAVAPEEPTKQLDLFAWRPREPKKGQLDLFGGDDDQR